MHVTHSDYWCDGAIKKDIHDDNGEDTRIIIIVL